MRIERNQAAGPSWRRWTLVTIAGWFVGFLAGFILAGAFEPILGAGPVQGVAGYSVLGVCLGSGVGLTQWLVLRRRTVGIGSWVLASAIGMGIAGGAGYGTAVLLFGYSEGLEGLGSAAAVLGWMLAAAFGGMVTGLLQWRILSRHLRGAGWWAPASTVGWALSFAALGAISVLGFSLTPVTSAFTAAWFLGGLIAGGAVLGAVTGGALLWLLNQPAAQV